MNKYSHPSADASARLQRGFTMVELVTVMVITGVLAALTLPKFFNRNAFEVRGFNDQVISTLRYAQKAAIAQHRVVCVTFGANPASVSLTQVSGGNSCPGSSPGNILAGLDGQATYSVSSNTVSFANPQPAALSFDALGRPGDNAGLLLTFPQKISVSQFANSITVENETGYVH